MRFGMSLLNIQGQVQGIAVGLMLIFSILLPNFARNISLSRAKFTWQPVAAVILIVAIFVLFFVFFYWSRAPVIAGV